MLKRYKDNIIIIIICIFAALFLSCTAAHYTASASAYNLISYDVPEGATYFKTYMGYKAITDKSSEQYKLQQEAYTDEYGLRKIDDYYLVAIGSYYSTTIGDKFVVYLEGGNRIKVIVGDFKDDAHTNDTHQYKSIYDMDGNFISKNVIGFIVDTSALDKTAKKLGDVSAIEGLNGNVIAIYKLEEIAYEKE